MDSVVHKKSGLQPKTLAELMPDLSGILTKEAAQALTAKKKPLTTIAIPTTTDKKLNIKPRTMAEMRADIKALKPPTPRRNMQPTSAMKRKWNSSVKVDQRKIINSSNKKHNSVRKVLDFHTNSKYPPPSNNTISLIPRITVAETQKFKPETSVKKSIYLQDRENIRISGVYKLPETSLLNNTRKFPTSRLTIVNKENVPRCTRVNKAISLQLNNQASNNKSVYLPAPNTPAYNTSSDTSFLQRENEANDIDIEIKSKTDEATLENIAEISPPASTPFKAYRSVHEYFNDSSDIDNSLLPADTTVMCFDKSSICKEDKKEDSVILSLCDLLTKATVTHTEPRRKEVNELVEMKNQILKNIKLIDNGIQIMTKIKEHDQKSLLNINKLMKEFKNQQVNREIMDKPVVEENKVCTVVETIAMSNGIGKKVTPTKSSGKSPSYKIPKRNMFLRNNVFCKSMPNISDIQSPKVKLDKSTRAISMYLKLKEQMIFLNTPKRRISRIVPDTPSVTSHNLQKQLDRLYNDS